MSQLKRIIMHWSAGGNTPSSVDREHYHFVVGGDGAVVRGVHTPEDNIITTDQIYGAHTRRLNTGSIGVAMAGMLGAVERPFNPGRAPLTAVQVEAFVQMVARLCRQYKIPVTRRTVLTHAEVQPTLGVEQRGKWDINWLPGDRGVSDPIAVGDRLRARIQAALEALK
jgi:N-acetyl-anhydromuramyl-L-alanine amidase AmpD